MTETQGLNGTGLLAEFTSHFASKGWDNPQSWRMEWNGNEGGDNSSSAEALGSNDQGGNPVQSQQDGGNPFLSQVQEAHRPIVEPYLKQWDADVTRRFQQLHSQYEPYSKLGADPSELQNAYQIYQQLNEDPRAFYTALAEALEIESEQGQPGGQNQGEPELPFQGLPEEFQQDYQQTRTALEAVASFILEQQQAQQAQAEDAELEEYMGQLQQQYGKFDEDYVLSKMYATGCTGEQAVQMWQQSIQEYMNTVAPPRTPRVLSGGGSVPSESQRVTDLSRGDTKQLVAEIMRQATQE